MDFISKGNGSYTKLYKQYNTFFFYMQVLSIRNIFLFRPSLTQTLIQQQPYYFINENSIDALHSKYTLWAAWNYLILQLHSYTHQFFFSIYFFLLGINPQSLILKILLILALGIWQPGHNESWLFGKRKYLQVNVKEPCTEWIKTLFRHKVSGALIFWAKFFITLKRKMAQMLDEILIAKRFHKS